MCGIFYYLREPTVSNQTEIDPIVISAFEKLHHRGPDFSDIKVYGAKQQHVIGFHRLSVINPTSAGNQPFEENNLLSICNGQIYNYRSLAKDLGIDVKSLKSDCEVILQLFVSATQRMSPELLRKLDGDFAGVIVDTAQDVVHAFRDPVGVRPLFYGINTTDKVIAFASEAKGLMTLPDVTKVFVFPPGHLFSSESNEFIDYTDIYQQNANVARHDKRDAQMNINRLFTEAVRKRVEHTQRPLAFLCSGGLDSSLVITLAQQMLRNRDMISLENHRSERENSKIEPSFSGDIHAFSVEYKDPGSQSPDSFYARLLLQQAGIKHTVVRYDKTDVVKALPKVIEALETYDPNTIRAAIPMYMLAKYIAENTDYKVLLSGEFADELFAGYNYFRLGPDGASVTEETMRLVKNIHMFDCLRADRCFAAYGLEIRVPFADKDLLRYVFSISGDLKKPQHGVEKALLRESFQELDILKRSRVLDRTKERMSDGCGLSYVPQLLTMINPKGGDLQTKQQKEKELYLSIFEDVYGVNQKHWVCKRELPEWAQHESSSMSGILAN